MTAGVYAGGTHTTWHVGSSKRTNVYHKLIRGPSKFQFIFQGMSLYSPNVFQDPY